MLIYNIDLSFKVYSTSPKAEIRDYCMHNSVSMPISKEHLKFVNFKNMFNEKKSCSKHNSGGNSHTDLLKPSQKLWNMNLREGCKMINDVIDSKALCFRQDYFVTTINLIKSHLP